MAKEIFTTDRAMEFFSETELSKQIGTSQERWILTIAKELIDNALDATEIAGNDPKIILTVGNGFLSVQDNGPGIPDQIIQSSLVFNNKVSDKQVYVSPSRGQQGNALMTMYGVSYLLNNNHAVVEVQTMGKAYDIEIILNQIKQEPEIKIDVNDGFVETGTLIKFNSACLLSENNNSVSTKQEFISLIEMFSACNKHVEFQLNHHGDVFRYAKTGSQIKWTHDMSLVSHWYDADKFNGLVGSMIKKVPGMSVNEFLGMFDGLKAPPKQKAVCTATGVNSRDGISQFALSETELNGKAICSLLDVIKDHAKTVKPQKLGFLDHNHVKDRLSIHGGMSESARSKGNTWDGLPYTMDVFFLVFDADVAAITGGFKEPEFCLNYSVLVDGGIRYQHSLMDKTDIKDGEPARLIIHIACPHFEFLSSGKNMVELDWNIYRDLKKQVSKVTKKWGKLKKQRHTQHPKETEKTGKLTIIQAVAALIEEAYMEVSGGGALPADYRQIYYEFRGEVLVLTGNTSLDSGYTSTVLKAFVANNPELTEEWNIAYNARGYFFEPFTNVEVPLGTIKVREYMDTWQEVSIVYGGALIPPKISKPQINIRGHQGNYKNVLFLEKEGFWPLLEQSKIQDRYGIGLASTKGMSNAAFRDLIERLSIEGVRIFCLHDFDKAGFTIAKILSEDTETFKFKVKPNVIDIGFRLEDIEGLEREPVILSKGENSPRQSILDAGATEDEADILLQGSREVTKDKNTFTEWYGERVELNAMRSRQFVSFIERKLEAHGVKKVVPNDEILHSAYRKIKAADLKKKALDRIMEKYLPRIEQELAEHENPLVEVPCNIRAMVEAGISGNELRWDQALMELI